LSLLLPAIVAVALIWGVMIFNNLVGARNQVAAAWSDIDVQLQRRHDLIPRLVEAVRGYTAYERATLEAVTELRVRSENARNRLAAEGGAAASAIAGLEQQIESDLHRIVALAESYPDLKANENFLALQRELTEIEDHLQYARRFYNGAVRNLNTRIQSFPDALVARPFRFVEAEFFEADSAADAPVEVSLS
jgi:LemA protein